MSKIISEKLCCLNKEWKDYIEQQQFYILMKTNQDVVDFLFHLEFSKPNKVTENFDIETSTQSFDITLHGWELTASYTGELQFEESDNFRIALYELYDGGSYSLSSWKVNANLDVSYEVTGLSFIDFLWEFDFDSEFNKVIDEILDKFQLQSKIEHLYSIILHAEKVERHKELVTQYDNTNIRIIEESGESFIVFHDNTKIKFPQNK